MKWYENPIYIKMCEKAKKIQKLRKKWQWGDFYCETPIELLNKGKLPSISLALSIDNKRYENETWLPNQDQLQEMLGSYERIIDILYDHDDYGFPLCNRYDDFTSMEQLWLAFVMKEKYNKIWNGKDWIKEK